jgi:hypothetical protein
LNARIKPHKGPVGQGFFQKEVRGQKTRLRFAKLRRGKQRAAYGRQRTQKWFEKRGQGRYCQIFKKAPHCFNGYP